eukprot:jgi/Mesvir1/26355/Mv22527-RA.1
MATAGVLPATSKTSRADFFSRHWIRGGGHRHLALTAPLAKIRPAHPGSSPSRLQTVFLCPSAGNGLVAPARLGAWDVVSKPCGIQPLKWGLKGNGIRKPDESGKRRSLVIVNAGGPGGGLKKKGHKGTGKPVETWQERLLLTVGLGYMALVLLVPTVNVFVQAFSNGVGPFIENLLDPDFQHAVKMTLVLAAIAVPLNTVFGISAALAIARKDFPGKVLLLSVLDLPFSISPVVTGLMLVLLYGRGGWFAPLLRATDTQVVFALPGMLLATAFVTMPFIVRELIPILEAMDPAEEEAARTLGANEFEVFWNVTLPNIRWGLMYGLILTNARAMGEFGAISVISGNIIGQTQTLTLFVESSYKEYQTQAAFSAAVLLSSLAFMTLFLKEFLESSASRETER